MQNEDLTLKQCEKVLNYYFHFEQEFLDSLRLKWEYLYKYEDPKKYENQIIERAKKHNVEIERILLNKEDFSLKVVISFNKKYSGHINIYSDKIETYVKEKVVKYMVYTKKKRG